MVFDYLREICKHVNALCNGMCSLLSHKSIKKINITLVIIYVYIDYCNSLLYGLLGYCLNRLKK